MGNHSEPTPLKIFKRIPIHVVEEHNDALQHIYSAIGAMRLPLENNTLLHLDAHPDMLVDRKLKGEEARAGKSVLPLLQIENWIVPAAAAGHIGRVVWLRPPWARQLADGTRSVRVGDQPDTGLLRLDSAEPYYLSDALFSPRLVNERIFQLTVAELSDTNDVRELANGLAVGKPYILDIDLDFFSTGNPFLKLYESIKLYDRLEEIFGFQLPIDDSEESILRCVESREKQLVELESLFDYLEKNNELDEYGGAKSELYEKVYRLARLVWKEAERMNERPDWWAIYAAGCTRDQGGLPHHISSDSEIHVAVTRTLKSLLLHLPQPTIITISRSTDDGYCPPDQVDLIQSLVLETLKDIYDSEEPILHYLSMNTD
ncbi:UPF0489 protein C5orf22 homolog [Aricia agestis]|uniref:UPF0489 protein C5orf22 homolog n=1 Tax=Aricia agestis TaxID=91739 RepID=UPI001C207C0C|nr:UPF0489 protein C5orf22 homolog [Aricia agestis]XP_041975478.1 UPF0489 protein C5orf22 homolog [Aricia agestis]XP_041975479.1 UPF0489 protein C5orf22 homolog [Aricia agestis]